MSFRKKQLIFCLIAMVVFLQQCHALSLFHVGNSFTFDSNPPSTSGILSGIVGDSVDYGFHVKGSQTLESLWNNPYSGGTSYRANFGPHPEALSNYEWDYLILQSFPSITNPTLGQEVDRIQDFVNSVDSGPSNGNTKIIVYGPWAGRDESAWAGWYDNIEDLDTQPTVAAADYHNTLYDNVETLYPGRVQLASAGKVLRNARDQILFGIAPDELSTTNHLYRDTIHLENLRGGFLASTTIQTTVLGRSTVGEPVASNYYSQLSDEYIRWARLTVWETLVADERSGVVAPATGDLDGNGKIDFQDYVLLEEDFGRTDRLLADASGNGVVDNADYDIWRDLIPIPKIDGDLNLDGKVSALDYYQWQEHLGREDRPISDISGNGIVDSEDFLIWRDSLPVEKMPGDYNLDERVDYQDYQLWNSEFGQSDQLFADGNGDGKVDAADYLIWREALQESNNPGDFNLDGKVNLLDLFAWQDGYGKSNVSVSLDIESQDGNQDGVVDAADYTIWRDIVDPLAIAADLNADGDINELDYALWRDLYGEEGSLAADANRDGVVNGADYTLWRDGRQLELADPLASLARFDQEVSLPASSIPEPNAVILALAGGIGILVKRGKRLPTSG